MKIKINPKFKNKIPELQESEFKQLEENIVQYGCREPLVVWNGFIVDGHNRYVICIKHNIPYQIKEEHFESEQDAIMFVIKNQLGRRNISAYQRAVLALEFEDMFTEKAKENLKLSEGRGKKGSQISDKVIDTKREVAKLANLSHDTIMKVKKIQNSLTHERREQLENKEKSINEIYKEIKQQESSERIKKERTEVAESAKNLPLNERTNLIIGDIEKVELSKKYDYIITDPPYPKEYLFLYEILAKRSNEWLKDGGLLIAMCGQSYLDEIYRLMSKHLDYYWTGCYLTQGQPTPLRHRNVNTTWKPLLMFIKKGDMYKGKIFGDVFRSDGNDKSFHKWGQSESGMQDIIQKITSEGQSILDPFCGAGTTGVASVRLNRLFDGIDIDEESINISKARIYDEATKRQT